MQLVYAVLTFGGRALGKLSRVFLEFSRRWEPAGIQQRSIVQSTRYDMVKAADEPYYAEQYWNVIQPHLTNLPRSAMALDLGCGQGRFTLRLARRFADGQVVGCDLSASAVATAQAYAARGSIRNVEFKVQSIRECLQGVREQSVDVALMTEVTFYCPEWRENIPRIARCLNPGGIAAISFRPQYFYAMLAVRDRNWCRVKSILDARQGRILDGSTTFSWQTSVEIRDLFACEPTLELVELRGVGVCSGIPGDPHDMLCRPSQLSNSERTHLMKLEQELGRSVPDGGRYMLAVVRKRGHV